MIDLNELLEPELLASFNQMMEVTRADGSVAVGALDQARAVLSMLVTGSGQAKVNEVSTIHVGRATVLPVLIAALLKDDPDPVAWIEAVAKGGFNLTGYLRYGEIGSDRGSPGNYLPRLLAKLDRLAGDPRSRSHPERIADLRTALCILIASVLLREMRRNIGAKAAMGPAWTVMLAVADHTKRQSHRELDALASDPKFLAHLGDTIASTVARYIAQLPTDERPALRSNSAIVSSPPAGADVEVHFSRKEEQERQLLSRFETAVLHELDTPGNSDSSNLCINHLDRAASDFASRIAEREDASHFEAAAIAATSYLDEFEAEVAGGAPPYDHAPIQRIRALMPVAFEDPGPIMRSSGMRMLRMLHDWMLPDLFRNERLDRVTSAVSRRIFTFASQIGPPPPATPLDHYPIFEAAGSFIALVHPDWDAQTRWQSLGMYLFPLHSAPEWSPINCAINLDLV